MRNYIFVWELRLEQQDHIYVYVYDIKTEYDIRRAVPQVYITNIRYCPLLSLIITV